MKRRRMNKQKPSISTSDDNVSFLHSSDVICINDDDDQVFQNFKSTSKSKLVTIVSAPKSDFPVTSQPKTVKDYILDVIPDCDEKFLVDYCNKLSLDASSSVNQNVSNHAQIQIVIYHLLEKGYDKSEKISNSSSAYAKNTENYAANICAAAAIGATAGKKYLQDYNSTTWNIDENYRSQVSNVLLNLFPCLSAHCAKWLLFAYKEHYAPCVQKICELLIQGAKKDQQYANQANNGPEFSSLIISKALSGAMLSQNQIKLLEETVANWTSSRKSITLKRPRQRIQQVVISNELKEEIEFINEKLKEARTIVAQIKARVLAREEARLKNMLRECGCCCDEFASMEMTKCTYGHEFCVDCLRKYAEEQLFGLQRPTLLCMNVGDNCSGTFRQTELERSLSKRALLKWNEASFQQAMEAAGLTNIAKCPKCEFQAELPETEMVFHCPAQGCGFESCRKCGEEAHVPLKCSEVEKKREMEGRNNVEEAMTAALKRECPTCKKSFFKSEGW